MCSDIKRTRRRFEGASLSSEKILFSFEDEGLSGERRGQCFVDEQHPLGSGGNQSWRSRCWRIRVFLSHVWSHWRPPSSVGQGILLCKTKPRQHNSSRESTLSNCHWQAGSVLYRVHLRSGQPETSSGGRSSRNAFTRKKFVEIQQWLTLLSVICCFGKKLTHPSKDFGGYFILFNFRWQERTQLRLLSCKSLEHENVPMVCWSPSSARRWSSEFVGSETPSPGVRQAVQALTRGNVSESDSRQPQASSFPKRGEATSSRGGEKRPSFQITLSSPICVRWSA